MVKIILSKGFNLDKPNTIRIFKYNKKLWKIKNIHS